MSAPPSCNELDALTVYLLQLDGSSSNPGQPTAMRRHRCGFDDEPPSSIDTRLQVTASDPAGDQLTSPRKVSDPSTAKVPAIVTGEDPTICFDRAGSHSLHVAVADDAGGNAAAAVEVSRGVDAEEYGPAALTDDRSGFGATTGLRHRSDVGPCEDGMRRHLFAQLLTAADRL